MVGGCKSRPWLPAVGHGLAAGAQTVDNGVCQADVFLADGVAAWEVYGGPRYPGCGRLRLIASGEAPSLDRAKAEALAISEHPPSAIATR
jgi:hypothetical protein